MAKGYVTYSIFPPKPTQCFLLESSFPKYEKRKEYITENTSSPLLLCLLPAKLRGTKRSFEYSCSDNNLNARSWSKPRPGSYSSNVYLTFARYESFT